MSSNIKIENNKKKRISPPGSMLFTGYDSPQPLEINAIQFDKETINPKVFHTVSDLISFIDPTKKIWIDINCLQHPAAIQELGNAFNIHYLTLEDIQNANERVKYAEFDNYVFLLIKMVYYDEPNKRINYEQVSIIIGKNLLITFQEFDGDTFDEVRIRLQNPNDHLRKRDIDYLAYSLVDTVVDGYYSVINLFADIIEELELELSNQNPKFRNDSPEFQKQFHILRYETLYLYRSVNPLISVINRLYNSNSSNLHAVNKKYILDISDHVNQITESVESTREMVISLQGIYQSNVDYNMNETMRTLTVVTTIFIPLSFIAGVYGMNFDYMPELKLTYGYLFIWVLLLAIAISMVIYFRKKRWI